MARLLLALVLSSAFFSGWAGRVSPDQVDTDAAVSGVSITGPAASEEPSDSIDFVDGDDPKVKSHWALLVAGSAGWGNYRHQADVYHAYQVLRSGGYREDHIVVMAYDDIAHNPENPMPGKVFNRPGGPDVYGGINLDYRGEDVTAETFLAVLEGDAAKVANKGTGRVIASGPNDKVFLFYSDHGAAGVVGMPSGPFLYADELLKTLRKKFHHGGFKEMVMYIEACESGSMFEGLLDDNMAAYVTTAANAFESSWATYCPEFFSPAPPPAAAADAAGFSSSAVPGNSLPTTTTSSSSSRAWLQVLLDGLCYIQHLFNPGLSLPSPSSSSSSSAPSGAAPEPTPGTTPKPQPPTPQYFTCLGDLYSVAWLEDAEVSDLTHETLLQQYKAVKSRTSQNFTYEQGSHVMQYGALDIDKEFAGDYEGMMHNGSVPPSPFPSPEWLEFETATQQQQQQGIGGRRLQGPAASSSQQQDLQQYSSVKSLTVRLQSLKKQHTVLQRDADLLPLVHAAHHSTCPRRRAAAAAALQQATAARQSLDSAARAAVAGLVRHPAVGYVMLANLGWSAAEVLPAAHPAALGAFFAHSRASQSHHHQQQQIEDLQVASAGAGGAGSSSLESLLGDVSGSHVEALMGPLPGREGQPLMDSWDCLRGMVQAWEAQCGQLDQYGMKQTRLFANLCNAGVHPGALQVVLAAGPCAG